MRNLDNTKDSYYWVWSARCVPEAFWTMIKRVDVDVTLSVVLKNGDIIDLCKLSAEAKQDFMGRNSLSTSITVLTEDAGKYAVAGLLPSSSGMMDVTYVPEGNYVNEIDRVRMRFDKCDLYSISNSSVSCGPYEFEKGVGGDIRPCHCPHITGTTMARLSLR